MTTQKYVFVLTLCFLLLFFRISQSGIHKSAGSSSADSAGNLRSGFSDQISRFLPSPQAELLSGMLIGKQSTLPKDFSKALQNTSTIHIVVVSGENLSLVAGFFLSFAPFLGRKKVLIGASILVFLYSYLTGFQAPVIRGAIMVELGFLAQILGKERVGVWALFLAGYFMVLFNPSYLVSISFELSFLATLAVLALAPELNYLFKRLPGVIRQDFAVSLSVELLILPIIAIYFHQVSLIGPLVNILVLWTVSFIMLSGAGVLIISFISLWSAQILAVIPGALLTYFIYIVEFCNSLTFATIRTQSVSPLMWIGYYVLLFTLYIELRQRRMVSLKNV